jgi:hypothetical protein
VTDEQQRAREVIQAVRRDLDPRPRKYRSAAPVTGEGRSNYYWGLALAFGGLLATFVTGVEAFLLLTLLGLVVLGLGLWPLMRDRGRER